MVLRRISARKLYQEMETSLLWELTWSRSTVLVDKED